MKTKSVIKLTVALILIVAVSILAFCGFKVGKYTYMSLGEAAKYDADLGEGTKSVFRVTGETEEVTAADLETLKERFETAYANTTCRIADGNTLVVTSSTADMGSYFTSLATTTWHISAELEDGTVAFTGDDIDHVEMGVSSTTNYYFDTIVLKEEKRDEFAAFTAEHASSTLQINLDGETIVEKYIYSQITDGTLQVFASTSSVEESYNGAANLALYLSIGEISSTVETIYSGNATAASGENATNSIWTFGAISLGIIAIVLIILYKANGLAAGVTLYLSVIAGFTVIDLMQLTLSRSTIMGFIAGTFVVLASLIVMLEMIKREKANGRTDIAATQVGCKVARALTLDITIVTVLASVVVMYFGNANSQAFGQALVFVGLIGGIAVAILTPFFIRNIARLSAPAKA